MARREIPVHSVGSRGYMTAYIRLCLWNMTHNNLKGEANHPLPAAAVMGSWTRALESGRITTLKGKRTTLYQLPPSWARGLEHWNLILDTNPELYFHLQQQRLIELICLGKVYEGLGFAQEELAPREDLEKTVALLAFEDAKNCPLGELLDVSQRLKTASEVNAAILTSQSREQDPKLPSLLKLLIWAQNQLVEKAVFPRINDLSTAALEDPTV